MHRLRRVILGAITATMLVASIALTIGSPSIEGVSAGASRSDAQALPIPELGHTHVMLFARLDPPADLFDRTGHCDCIDPNPEHVHPGQRGHHRSSVEEP